VAAPISVVVERGGVVEAVHRVHAVAVRDGEVVDSAGDPDLVTHMRSVAKPLQALPLAVEASDLPPEELAIACASHEATEAQLAAVRALLARSQSRAEELECGVTRGSRLAHNCSGKHAGMLLRTKMHGWPLPGYRLPDHPLQRDLRRVVADALDRREHELGSATDGCGVVTFAAPLAGIASAFARLARAELDGADRVVAAMRAHPDLVGGPGAADTALMRALPGAVAKRGMEGLLCATLPDGTGAVVKVEDGGNRAPGPAMAEFLGLEELREAPVFNSRCEEVGRVFPRSQENRVHVFPRPV
jgi:L-asparaginase II